MERIYAHAVRRRRRPAWWRGRALVPAAAALAAAALAAVLFWPSDGAGPLERAAAAVAPSGRIVHFRFEVRYEQRDAGGQWEPIELVTMHDWALFREGKLVRARRFISAGPLTEPPTDEDTSVVVTGDGRIEMTSWVAGEVRHDRAPDDVTLDRLSVAGYLRSLYTSGKLEEAGRDAEGIHLRGTGTACGDDMAVSEVVVDPQTFLPRRMVETACGPDADAASRRVWRFTEAETLPDTPANRRLLEVGDWPVGGEAVTPVDPEGP